MRAGIAKDAMWAVSVLNSGKSTTVRMDYQEYIQRVRNVVATCTKKQHVIGHQGQCPICDVVPTFSSEKEEFLHRLHFSEEEIREQKLAAEWVITERQRLRLQQ